MRQFCVMALVIGVCSPLCFAQGQATVTSGWASNIGISGYTYGAQFVPQIVTPNISFSTYSADPVGATNATTGNVAGATNSTIDNGIGSTGSVMTVPVWYGAGVPAAPAMRGPMPTMMHHMREMHARSEEARYFDFGSARYHRQSVADLAISAKGETKKASRTYGNEDVERQNQNNGVVKYRGKTENIG